MRNKILEDREKRYELVLNLIQKHKMTVLCGKINYCGNDKNSVEVKKAFGILLENLKANFTTWTRYTEIINGYDGPAVLMVLDMNLFKAKELGIRIEEKMPIGRVFDIDIYKVDGNSVSRADINIEPRKCLICDMDGRVCMRLGKHTLNDIKCKINSIIKDNGETND